MYATMFLMTFLLFIPKTLKNTGIKLIIDGKKQGIFVFMFSKILWWFLILQIANIWFTGIVLTAIQIFALLGFVYKLIKERNYFSIALKKRSILE